MMEVPKMKKTFGAYIAGWAVVLGLFNIITFVTPNEIDGVSKYDNLFWIAYVLITLFFVAQLACTYFVFHADSLQKTFYSIPLFNISVGALISTLVVGGLCMAVMQIPTWLGVIVCALVVTAYIISFVKSSIAISTVSEIDKKIKMKTFFVKSLTADAEALMARADNEQMQFLTKKVLDAIRYSDPMSDSALCAVEDEISDVFGEFSTAVEAGNIESAQGWSKKLLSLISARNAKCKFLK